MTGRAVSNHIVLSHIYLLVIVEWAETKLLAVNSKWDRLEKEVNMRQHRSIMYGSSAAQPGLKPSPAKGSRATLRVFGPGGVYEKALRKEYEEGLWRLENNKFRNEAAKQEWISFRNQLTDEEKAVVTAGDWK